MSNYVQFLWLLPMNDNLDDNIFKTYSKKINHYIRKKKNAIWRLKFLIKSLSLEEYKISTTPKICLKYKTLFANVQNNCNSNRKLERIYKDHQQLHQKG